eukprot:TRINITY_DN102056_c0_g1_i1.p1 TRINITY_DN102056_c0_g1~~TRINITY_DN102056_c0_g1_i1.p1  ORF type:complete len:592 (+),score=82.61 TRINITY_DN102056_c0_g1_i1:106-1776(+)
MNGQEKDLKARRVPSNSSQVTDDEERPELSALLTRAWDLVKPWEPRWYSFTKTLQDAPRNQGRVDMMKSLELGHLVAVKRMPNSWIQTDPHTFRRLHPKSSELPWLDIAIVDFLSQKDFPFVCRLMGVFHDNVYTYVVSELATEGDLFNWKGFTLPPGPDREKMLKPLVQQVSSALQVLHSYGIGHQDVSLENILMTKGDDGAPPRAKLIDFGMATLGRFGSCKLPRGKVMYQAPEMNRADVEEYDGFLADAFAFGVVIFSLAAHDYPWSATSPPPGTGRERKSRGQCQLFAYVRQNGMRRFLEKRVAKEKPECHLIDILSPELADLLVGLLTMDPSRRLTFGEDCYESGRLSLWGSSYVDAENSFVRQRSSCSSSSDRPPVGFTIHNLDEPMQPPYRATKAHDTQAKTVPEPPYPTADDAGKTTGMDAGNGIACPGAGAAQKSPAQSTTASESGAAPPGGRHKRPDEAVEDDAVPVTKVDKDSTAVPCAFRGVEGGSCPKAAVPSNGAAGYPAACDEHSEDFQPPPGKLVLSHQRVNHCFPRGWLAHLCPALRHN